ncbi:NAD(P)(+) transhydrogenase (Re/Si-specific) subunit alpha, partial [bacterium]
MIVGVLREMAAGERRVALVPASVPFLAKSGLEVVVESGAGEAAGYPDNVYTEKGARLADRAAVLGEAQVLVQVTGPGAVPGAELNSLRKGLVLIGMQDPLGNPEGTSAMADAGLTGFSLEMVPRITRAQSMDVLSSMATVAG